MLAQDNEMIDQAVSSISKLTEDKRIRDEIWRREDNARIELSNRVAYEETVEKLRESQQENETIRILLRESQQKNETSQLLIKDQNAALKQKDNLIEQKDVEIARLKKLLEEKEHK